MFCCGGGRRQCHWRARVTVVVVIDENDARMFRNRASGVLEGGVEGLL